MMKKYPVNRGRRIVKQAYDKKIEELRNKLDEVEAELEALIEERDLVLSIHKEESV